VVTHKVIVENIQGKIAPARSFL